MKFQCKNCILECEIVIKYSKPSTPKDCLFFTRKANWQTIEEKIECVICEFYEPDIKKCPISVEKWCKANNYKSFVQRGTLHVQSPNQVSAQINR